MKKIIFLILILGLCIPVHSNEWIDGKTIYYNLSGKGLITQTPHTLTQITNYPIVNFTSYFVTEQCFDFAFGFNTSQAKPVDVDLLSPHNVSWVTQQSQFFHNVSSIITTSDACDFGYEYNMYKRKIEHQEKTEYNNITNQTDIIISNSIVCFDSYIQNGTNYTVSWYKKHSRIESWKNIKNKFGVLHETHFDKNTWYYITDTIFQPGEIKTIRPKIIVPPTLGENSGKYDILIKRCSDTISEAISSGNYIRLDPWWNSTLTHRYKIQINNTAAIAHDYEILGSDTKGIDITGTVCGSYPNSTRIMFKNTSELAFEWYNSSQKTLYLIYNYSLPANSYNNSLYLYCAEDNSIVEANTTIFNFRSDFEDSSLPKWEQYGGSPLCNYSTIGSKIGTGCMRCNSNQYLETVDVYFDSIVNVPYFVSIYMDIDSGGGNFGGIRMGTSSNTDAQMNFQNDNTGFGFYNGATWNYFDNTDPNFIYHLWNYESSIPAWDIIDVYIDDTLQGSNFDAYRFETDTTFNHADFGTGLDEIMNYDEFFVSTTEFRVFTDPSNITLGAVEQESAGAKTESENLSQSISMAGTSIGKGGIIDKSNIGIGVSGTIIDLSQLEEKEAQSVGITEKISDENIAFSAHSQSASMINSLIELYQPKEKSGQTITTGGSINILGVINEYLSQTGTLIGNLISFQIPEEKSSQDISITESSTDKIIGIENNPESITLTNSLKNKYTGFEELPESIQFIIALAEIQKMKGSHGQSITFIDNLYNVFLLYDYLNEGINLQESESNTAYIFEKHSNPIGFISDISIKGILSSLFPQSIGITDSGIEIYQPLEAGTQNIGISGSFGADVYAKNYFTQTFIFVTGFGNPINTFVLNSQSVGLSGNLGEIYNPFEIVSQAISITPILSDLFLALEDIFGLIDVEEKVCVEFDFCPDMNETSTVPVATTSVAVGGGGGGGARLFISDFSFYNITFIRIFTDEEIIVGLIEPIAVDYVYSTTRITDCQANNFKCTPDGNKIIVSFEPKEGYENFFIYKTESIIANDKAITAGVIGLNLRGNNLYIFIPCIISLFLATMLYKNVGKERIMEKLRKSRKKYKIV